MAKKSKAQLKRLMKRAEARGEVYEPPCESEEPKDGAKEEQKATKNDDDTQTAVNHQEQDDEKNNKKKEAKMMSAAAHLQKELAAIESNKELKSKERRSAKRKAEAIAIESSGCASTEELLQWYEENNVMKKKTKADDSDANTRSKRDNNNPYIVFIGQLSYDTTKEQLFEHIKKELKDEHTITHENIQIRLLTDPKTKKSRGMAFVQVQDGNPELLYSCLKLHHTHLQGRRINVERSAGGGSEARKHKIKQYRNDQEQYIDATVTAIFEEYYQSGEIARSELDDGVIALCKRHSATVVQAALERYVEANGRDMDNPSAYLSFLIGKLATEGIYTTDRASDEQHAANKKQKQRHHHGTRNSNNNNNTKNTSNSGNSNKRPRKTGGKNSNDSSSFAKQGVDMTSSSEGGGKGDLLRIFPSLGRGRGRGRGYM